MAAAEPRHGGLGRGLAGRAADGLAGIVFIDF